MDARRHFNCCPDKAAKSPEYTLRLWRGKTIRRRTRKQQWRFGHRHTHVHAADRSRRDRTESIRRRTRRQKGKEAMTHSLKRH